jgi:type II secretory pathway pseudopilin PulG
MPTGNRQKARRFTRGFTYLGLLALLAIQGAALAALGRHVSTAVQRDKEAELRFRGQQIQRAIDSYQRAQQPPQPPTQLQQLLVDERVDPPRHHLRRLWADPFTGQADWEELRDEGSGALRGVRSRSDTPRLAEGGVSEQGDRPRVSDWQFVATPPEAPASAAAQAVQNIDPGGPS